MDKQKYLQSMKKKLDDLESKLDDLKVKYSNIAEKSNKIFEEDIMKVEIHKNNVRNYMNQYGKGSIDSTDDIEKSITDYDQKVNEVLKKHKYEKSAL